MREDGSSFPPEEARMATTGAPVEYSTAAAAEEKAKLQKHFTRFDIYFFLICTIVGVDTLGQVASNGAEGLTWLLVLAVLFFIPYALLTAELGAAFTEEGGSYVWTRLAWGRFTACINAVFYWFSNPVWIGGALVLLALEAINIYFFDISTGGFAWYAVGLVYIWFSVWSAILSFGIGKWIPTLGAWCRMVLLGGFTISALIYAISNGLSLPAAGDFSPSYGLFIILVPVLFFNYVGFELPNAAGDEMKDPQRDVPITVLRAMVTAILMYGLPILAIVCVLPKSQITGVGGFMDSVKAVFTVFGGRSEVVDGALVVTLTGAGKVLAYVAAFGFVLALVSSACTWLMGSDRSQAVAAYDGCGPRWLGTFSARYGTPINVNLTSGVLSTIVFVFASQLSGDSAKIFAAMIGVVLLFTTMSYILIFPTVIKLRKSHANVHRPFKIPFGMNGVWFCGVICTFWAVFASIVGIFPGLGNGEILNDQDLSDAYGLSRAGYTSIALGAIAVTFLVGVLFYWAGAKTRAEMVPNELPPEITGEAQVAPAPTSGD
jgi:glutamate:GABA antiporter